MSGLDFLDRTTSSGERLRVILTTGISSADQAVAALSRGAFDFLPKPFTYEELMSPIARACRDIEFTERGAGREAPDDPELLFLGRQAWARPEGGSIRLGASHSFQRNAGKIMEVIPPRISVELGQGGPLARVRTEDERWHVVLAAVGGRVSMVNGRLIDAPHLLNDDPWRGGWIAEVQASELYRDLPNLSR
jgi:glycine cleavage system H lipoate-binding protein